ncbi:MAG: response regulator transcription factor [Candidatus Omnitrophica bacterium]|jgi:DNA-binding response OmpR family regulator|nr:response regulator transcription factor [Candidatus Omnitrophota bacterium]
MNAKVLLISDSDDLKALAVALKESPHFVSRQAAVNEIGPDLTAKAKPDLLVVSTTAAGLLQACERIKMEKPLAELPLFAVLDVKELAHPSFQAPTGVYDVFTRPLRVEECVARLVMAFKKFNRISDKNVIVSGDLEIDVSRYEVRVGGDKVDLTYTEYQLLKFLASHPGQVFDRDALLNKVWGYEYFGGARTVDVHVRRLRSKIEIKKRSFIETVRNIGYKFIQLDND